jgi:hypothetical protein
MSSNRIYRLIAKLRNRRIVYIQRYDGTVLKMLAERTPFGFIIEYRRDQYRLLEDGTVRGSDSNSVLVSWKTEEEYGIYL